MSDENVRQHHAQVRTPKLANKQANKIKIKIKNKNKNKQTKQKPKTNTTSITKTKQKPKIGTHKQAKN